MVKNPEGVRVVIYDLEYNMKGEVDPEYIRKLAKYLDTKMRSIAGRSRTVDSLRVAILAGLNIADEYHQLKTKQGAANEEVEERIGECSRMLDEILKLAG